MYWVNEICGPKEMMMAVKSGLADVVGHVPAYTPGETPIWNSTFLPFLAAPRLDQSMVLYPILAEKSQPFIKEMDNFNCVYAGGYENEGYNLMGKKAIRKCDDLKGVRVRCMPDLGKVLKQFGAVPMTVPVTEMYSALDKGIVDIVAHSRLTFHSYKVDEISKYMMLEMDMGAAPTIYFINKDSWKKLPDDLKAVVKSVIDDLPLFMWKFQHKPERIAAADKVIKEKGIEIIKFPKAERAKLMSKAEGVWDGWAKRSGDYENAKRALADYIKLRDEVIANYPNGVPGS
jgi:TRAP-type C4-dicarboxylate transport system substrate-binding protein